MKAVMKSVSPRICEKVASGDCTILVSKTAPKCEVPFKCYIYCTMPNYKTDWEWEYKPYLYIEDDKLKWIDVAFESITFCYWAHQKVIGEFICDEIIEWQYDKGHQYYVGYPDDCTSYFPYLMRHSKATGLRCSELEKLGKGKTLYGWHISDLKIYDKPKMLVEFYKCGAESFKELFDVDGLCQYCSETDHGEHKYDISSRWGMISCEGRWCDEAYQQYLDENFALTRAPSNWQYVEEL